MQLIIVGIEELFKVSIMHFVGSAYSFRVIVTLLMSVILILNFLDKRFGSDITPRLVFTVR